MGNVLKIKYLGKCISAKLETVRQQWITSKEMQRWINPKMNASKLTNPNWEIQRKTHNAQPENSPALQVAEKIATAEGRSTIQLSTLRHLQTRLLTTWQCDMITWDLPMASIRRVYQHVIILTVYTIYIYIMMYMMYLYTLRPPGFPSLLTTMLGWVVWGVGVGVGGVGFQGGRNNFPRCCVLSHMLRCCYVWRWCYVVATFAGWGCYVDVPWLQRRCYVCKQSCKHCLCTEEHVPKESCKLALQIVMKQRSCRDWTDEKMALEATANQAAGHIQYVLSISACA